jgi:hypothetical protein
MDKLIIQEDTPHCMEQLPLAMCKYIVVVLPQRKGGYEACN